MTSYQILGRHRRSVEKGPVCYTDMKVGKRKKKDNSTIIQQEFVKHTSTCKIIRYLFENSLQIVRSQFEPSIFGQLSKLFILVEIRPHFDHITC